MAIEVGSVLDGNVTGITNFGAFVSLPGNRSGLVHISEIADSYVNDVHEHLSEGQEVKVIGVDASNRINLSIKQAAPPPPRPERHQPRPYRRPDPPARRPSPSRPFAPEPALPKGPDSFEDQLKQFMASSDSKLSELHMNEKRGNRRSGRR